MSIQQIQNNESGLLVRGKLNSVIDQVNGSGSLATTGSNTFTANQVVSGSVNITGSLTASGLTYPITDGLFGVEVLQTDGSGNLEFEIPKTVYESVKNVSGVTLLKGSPVHSVGTSGFSIEVIAADAGDPSTMPATLILNQDLNDEEEGLGVAIGAIQGINTNGLTAGDAVYVAVGGGFTQTKPTGSALIQNLGIITKVGVNGGGIVLGAGRSNDIPNLPPDTLFVGNEDSVATPFSASNFFTGSYTGSFIGDGSGLTGLGGGDPFPFTGSAIISGSLEVIGNLEINDIDTLDLEGNLIVTGSIIAQSFTGSFSGSFVGNGSGLTALPVQDPFPYTGSAIISGSLQVTGSINATSFVGDGSSLAGLPLQDPFPYTGSAIISGSLEVTGSITGIVLSPVLEITASSILSFDQSSKYLLANSGSAMTLTIPSSSDVPFFIGTSITVEQNGTGVVTFETGSGVTINTSTGYNTNGQYTVASLHKVNTDTWTLIGGVS